MNVRQTEKVQDRIRELSAWYESQCDGDWEHQSGITIESLDNPGWRVRINLDGTPLERVAFTELSNLEPERDWIRCWVADNAFNGAGGPQKLGEIIEVFLEWARSHGWRAV